MRQNISTHGAIGALMAVALLLAPTVDAQYNGLLVVGIPDYDDSVSVTDSGAISVLHSIQGTGVSTTSSRFFDQDSTYFDNDNGPNTVDNFGQAVVVGDFNGWDPGFYFLAKVAGTDFYYRSKTFELKGENWKKKKKAK